ncbi:uncharacterized protein I303_102920 [Kwoniella dejecticola CBS 10117]|uniref:Uncharacterized protein n=1 Tax=Kwoniella dejecticola CBS 10117 TaxID=1296121 RepID=A0A1A6AA38_9TREE|nr:uncharacterized protein I303_02940 [Kwoniella dejecticola CBS 10117]OBR86919.1 hypothetical protein I303_02940 [Kwoniella dejecticola CBS 10117]
MPTLLIRQDPSSTTQSASSTTSNNAATESTPVFNNNPGGGSTTLYLFTFLITILVLGLISSGLLIRAYILRRRFHRRVEEAIRRGEALPTDAATALGLLPRRPPRGKKEKKHGLMPTMWESEMWRDDEKAGLKDEHDAQEPSEVRKDGWDELTPLSILHYTTSNPAEPPQPQIEIPPPLTPGAYFRSLWSSRGLTTTSTTTNTNSNTAQRPGLPHRPTSTIIPTQKPVFAVPDAGEEVVLGVMIAMPSEGAMEERWNPLEEGEEERELPEVCLGVLGTTMKE